MFLLHISAAVLFTSSVFAVFAGPNDPRIDKWSRMKIALPDGILPEDPVDFHAAMRPPILKDQYPEVLGYKQSSLPQQLRYVAPLPLSLTSEQASKSWQLTADPNSKPHNKIVVSKSPFKGPIQEKHVVGLDDQGKLQYIDLPDYHRT